MNDEETAEVLKELKRCRLQLHVRGTDARPVIELRDSLTKRIVGGSELKRRLAE